MRLIRKLEQGKFVVYIDHPETDELVRWKDLSDEFKNYIVRKYFKNAFDVAYNELMFKLGEGNTPEDKEISSKTKMIGRKFLGYMCGLDFDTTNKTDRGNFRELWKKSTINI